MIKNTLSGWLRRARLLYIIDYIRFITWKLHKYPANHRFLREHPGLVLPPDYLIYESFQLDYRKYYTDSRETARWLIGLISKQTPLQGKKILDWGCGPGRIVRHLPDLLPPDCQCFGTDYNERTIVWCQQNIQGVTFSANQLEPPLPSEDCFFDLVYGISIFTHLSKEMHEKWIAELYRVLSPGGILLFTTQGSSFTVKLTGQEKRLFEEGHLVVRGKVKEGHRTYSAFQPAPYMKVLLRDFTLLEYQEKPGHQKPQQDIWLVQRPV